MAFKKWTEKELIDIIVDYYNKIGFPTVRKFTAKNNLPSSFVYYKRFGSFKNAILISGIEIPINRLRYFDREKSNDEEMLGLLKYYTKEKIKKGNTSLLTAEEIDNNSKMPHTSTYTTHFGSLTGAYKKINIDYYKCNNQLMKNYLKKQYLEVKRMLGHTPNSRELDKLSKQNLCCSMSTYETYFGSLSNLQKYMGDIPTYLGISITKEEIVEKLYKLYDEIGDIPTQKDIDNCEYLPSSGCVISHFGSTREMQKELFGDTYSKIKITENGTVCSSSYEYIFARMLEIYNISFGKEELYKDYIMEFNKKYKFDFTVKINNKKYFIEIFGITGNKKYNNKTSEKIKLCKDNNLPLIEMYPEDFRDKNIKDLYDYLMDYINTFNK